MVSKLIQNLLTKRNGSLIMSDIFFTTTRKRTNQEEVREEDREGVAVVDTKIIINHTKAVEEVEAKETIIMANTAISNRSTQRKKINNNLKIIIISILENRTINHNIKTNITINITTVKVMIIDKETITRVIDRRAIIKKKEKTTIKITIMTTDRFNDDRVNWYIHLTPTSYFKFKPYKLIKNIFSFIKYVFHPRKVMRRFYNKISLSRILHFWINYRSKLGRTPNYLKFSSIL